MTTYPKVNGIIPPLSTTEGLLVRFEAAVSNMAVQTHGDDLAASERQWAILRSILIMRLEGPAPIPDPDPWWPLRWCPEHGYWYGIGQCYSCYREGSAP